MALLSPLTFTACQTITDYQIIGSKKQKLVQGDAYTINDKADQEKAVDLSTAALKAKREITGNYVVEKQWNRYLHWNIEKVNIRIENGSVIADLYAHGKSKPFYGLKANDCTTIDFAPKYDDPILVERLQNRIKGHVQPKKNFLEKTIHCGFFQYDLGAYNGVIELKTVKKGYQTPVFENHPVDILTKWTIFTVPEDGYIITLRDKKISGGWQDLGSAEITIYAKR